MLVRCCDKNEMGIKFEYTAPGTLEQNGVVKRVFIAFIGRGRAMMNFAGFTVKRQEMWCEATQTATMLDNVMVQEKGGKRPHMKFYGEDSKYAKYLKTFGESWKNQIGSKKTNKYVCGI